MPKTNSKGKWVYSFDESRRICLAALDSDIKREKDNAERLEKLKKREKIYGRMRELISEGKTTKEIRDILVKEYPEETSVSAKTEISEGVSQLEAKIMDQIKRYRSSEPR